MKLPSRGGSTGHSLGMMPMIDVVFLLLIYFLWTTSFDPPPFELPGSIAAPPETVAMSSGATMDDQPVEAFDELIVRLRSDGDQTIATLNDQPVNDPSSLSARIEEIVRLGINPPIIVDPDGEVSMNDVIAFYDAARLGGGDRVLFAVEDGE